jgi:hypothetical protein
MCASTNPIQQVLSIYYTQVNLLSNCLLTLAHRDGCLAGPVVSSHYMAPPFRTTLSSKYNYYYLLSTDMPTTLPSLQTQHSPTTVAPLHGFRLHKGQPARARIPSRVLPLQFGIRVAAGCTEQILTKQVIQLTHTTTASKANC